MMQFVRTLGGIFLAWACLSTLFAGIGLLLVRAIGCKVDRSISLLTCLWIGWGFSISFLQIWHLFSPVNHMALLSLVPISLLGILWGGRDLKVQIKTSTYSRKLLGVQIAAAAWLAYHAICQPGNSDSGLYHVTMIKWCIHYPAVPGLGNLHDRLAFNCSYFLYPAMLNAGFFVDKYHQLASSLLILWALFKVTSAWSRIIKGKNISTSDVLDALFLVPVLNLGIDGFIVSSPTPDVAVFLLGFFIGSDLIRFAAAEISITDVQSWNSYRLLLFAIVFLSTIGIVLKLSFAVFGALSILLAVLNFFQRAHYRQHGWLLLSTCLLVGLTVGTWMVRGIILGGYPAFPSTLGAVNVDWRIPTQAAQHLKILSAWARHPGPDWATAMTGWGWLKGWVVRTSQNPDVTLPMGLLIGAVAFVPFALSENRGRHLVRQLLVLTAPGAAIVFWFFQAPDPRFLGASLWLLGFVVMAIALIRMPRSVLVPVLVLCTGLLFFGRINVLLFLRSPHYDPGPLTTASTVAKTTHSGLTVYVPAEGENQQCWNAPLPCTPYFNPALRLREAGNLAKGFRVEE